MNIKMNDLVIGIIGIDDKTFVQRKNNESKIAKLSKE